ncbi:hypothetical protein [Pseudomonas fluorescens]|nr:hypothetical protein [Pseudomonas fluorescens]
MEKPVIGLAAVVNGEIAQLELSCRRAGDYREITSQLHEITP